MEILQKHLELHRLTVDRPSGKYVYCLFRSGETVKNVSSDLEYQYGQVTINPITGKADLDLIPSIDQVSFDGMEDQNSFLVKVDIK